MSDNFALKYKFRIEMACEASTIIETLLMLIGKTKKAKIFHLSFGILEEDEDA